MNDMKSKIHYGILTFLLITGVSLAFTTFMDWFIPSPLISFIFEMLALGLFAVARDKRKETLTLFSIATYINLIIASFIYKIWTFETIFTRIEMTRFSLLIFLLISLLLIIAYLRAKKSYKQVQGNQPHNNSWHISKNKLKKIQDSDDIYINLGIFEKTDKK
ncbi:hypothetical protein [Bacillus benzoevorans]|uniref:Uncharacterized protein n=1 Tax=Bacillus benzoevorans TaxID=1456 RepID=A0A7X0LX70_9BACI|nr:hypothetical protein [Bacillus benzoevorans]MBB6447866.1 hypothetical protein [Bacillus benzoevorans]